jgi:hypothetical protein
MSDLRSEQVVVSAPMSLHGSSVRLWKLTRPARSLWRSSGAVGRELHPAARVALLAFTYTLAAMAVTTIYVGVAAAIAVAWVAIGCWYLLFGLFLVPYRMMRRSSRNKKVRGLQHRELLDAVGRQNG